MMSKTLNEVYEECLNKYVDESDNIFKERGLKNNFGGTMVPENTVVRMLSTDRDITLKAGVMFPITIKNIIRMYVYRELGSKKYIRLIDKKMKYPYFYNLDGALEDRDFVITCEGIYDCESIKQSLGINNVISTLTASINKEQMIVLGCMFKTVYVAFDMDEAGLRAFEKIESFIREYNMKAQVIYLEYKGKDPNECLVKYGKKELAKDLIQDMI